MTATCDSAVTEDSSPAPVTSKSSGCCVQNLLGSDVIVVSSVILLFLVVGANVLVSASDFFATHIDAILGLRNLPGGKSVLLGAVFVLSAAVVFPGTPDETAKTRAAAKRAALLSSNRSEVYVNSLKADAVAEARIGEKVRLWKTKYGVSGGAEGEAKKGMQKEALQLSHWSGGLKKNFTELHRDILDHVWEYTLPTKEGFHFREKVEGLVVEMHEGMTKASNAKDGYFRLSGEVAVPASLLTALLMDPSKTGYSDPTIMTLDFFHRFDERSVLSYWAIDINTPGSCNLLAYRDGVDLSTFSVEKSQTDTPPTFFQASTAVSNSEEDFALFGEKTTLRATDMYWGYRMEPRMVKVANKEVEGAFISLLCQTDTGGRIPVWLKNRMCGQVLAKEYVRGMERLGQDMLAAGTAKDFVASFGDSLPGLYVLGKEREFVCQTAVST